LTSNVASSGAVAAGCAEAGIAQAHEAASSPTSNNFETLKSSLIKPASAA
jgi:hypothetical protein